MVRKKKVAFNNTEHRFALKSKTDIIKKQLLKKRLKTNPKFRKKVKDLFKKRTKK